MPDRAPSKAFRGCRCGGCDVAGWAVSTSLAACRRHSGQTAAANGAAFTPARQFRHRPQPSRLETARRRSSFDIARSRG